MIRGIIISLVFGMCYAAIGIFLDNVIGVVNPKVFAMVFYMLGFAFASVLHLVSRG